MTVVLRRVCVSVGVALAGACGAAFPGAATAWARTVRVDARAHIAYVATTRGRLQFAGTVTGPALGHGALLASFGRRGSGYAGTATLVGPPGSLTGNVRVSVHLEGHLVRLGFTADVTGATGRFAGARGTLTGSGLVTATESVGTLRLHGTLSGASGRAPAPPRRAVAHHVDGRFLGAELSLARNGVETVIGSATGLVPGPAVLVAEERATTTRARGPCTVFAAGGTLTGFVDVRFPGAGHTRHESGTYSFSRGTGAFSGVHPTSLVVSGRRNLAAQEIATRFKGTLTL